MAMRFVADAMAKGAAGAMVHRDVPDAGHLLLVDDTLAGLHRLGGYARHRFTGQLDRGHRQRRQDHDEGDAADDPVDVRRTRTRRSRPTTIIGACR